VADEFGITRIRLGVEISMKMKLILAESIVSALYVFDASASPLLHIPLSYLTLIYIVSMLEVFGFFKLVRYARGRFARTSAAIGKSRLFGL
jgi:hypothetical protein